MFLANGNSTSISQLTGKRLLKKTEDLTKVVVYIMNDKNLPAQIGIYVPKNKIILYQRKVPTLQEIKVTFYNQRISGKVHDNLTALKNIRVMDVSSFIQNLITLKIT